MSAVAIRVAIVALAAIICVCGGSVCYMGKQPDPNHPELGLRWVLPYTKEVLCTCTKILFGGINMMPPAGSEDFFYPDDPMSLVNNDDAEELRVKLKCVDMESRGAPSKDQSTTESSPTTVASSTSSTATKAESTTETSPTSVASSTSSTTSKAQSTSESSPTTVASSTTSTTTKPQSTTESSATTVASSTSSTTTKAQSTSGSSPTTVASSTSSPTTKPHSTAALSPTHLLTTTSSSTTGYSQGADCVEIFNQGHSNNGVYTLSPDSLDGGSLDVWCDMENGGWILIQQRFDGSVNFNRNWTSYQNGFGTPPGEYWLGLDNIREFTNSGGTWKLRVDLEDWHNHTGYAEYSEFELEDDDYELHVDGYTGNIRDAMEYHDNRKFSTPDRRNGAGDCASENRSGWWFKNCHKANLNGVYSHTHDVQFNQGIQWEKWTRYHGNFDMNKYSMKSASMKIKEA